MRLTGIHAAGRAPERPARAEQHRVSPRPGLILAATALAAPLAPLENLARRIRVKARRDDIDPSRIAGALATDVAVYVAYVGLNICVLLLSFYVFELICGSPAPDTGGTILFASAAFVLAANDVVKAFVWSPHTQMFNILVRLFAVWASVRANKGWLLDGRFVTTTAVVMGLRATAYPLFVILLPCMFVSGLPGVIRDRSRTTVLRFGANSVLAVALTLLPEGLWYLFVRDHTGGFYQHELALGEVRWIFQAAAEHGLVYAAETWLSNVGDLLRLAAPQALPLAVLLLVTCAISGRHFGQAFDRVRATGRSCVAASWSRVLRDDWPDRSPTGLCDRGRRRACRRSNFARNPCCAGGPPAQHNGVGVPGRYSGGVRFMVVKDGPYS